MHRSSSTTRASDEYYLSVAAQTGPAVGGTKGTSVPGPRSSTSGSAGVTMMEIDQLPTYDPQSEVAKKEALRARFAENMVHLIPIIIIVCAMVLWLFSNPEIDLGSQDDSILARVKNMTIDGYSNWNGTLMTTELEDLDPLNKETGMELENKEPE